ncbi:MAG: diphthine synthase [archaeon]
MLYLIGIGLKPSHITLEALDAIKDCTQIFLEEYTSIYSEGFTKDLNQILMRDVIGLGRKEVEEGFSSALLSSRRNNIALLVFGNPLTATTHLQLLLDAKENGVKVKIIPGISITNTIAETGLDEYKFGRTVTICYHSEGYEPESFFDQIKENQKIGLHTLCLLDIKRDGKQKRLMNCKEAIEVLEKISNKREQNNNFEYLGLFGMASEKQKILFEKEKILTFKEIYDVYPQSLIVLGKTNEKENEALNTLNK